MPKSPKRLCTRAGCQGLVRNGECSICGKRPKRSDNRATANSKGYNYEWQQYRKHFLSVYPLCERCKKMGRITEATVVHHIVPVSGRGDPLFNEPDNHQPLCHECHEIIHGRKREVTSG